MHGTQMTNRSSRAHGSRNPESTRNALRDAALQAFLEGGYSTATIGRIVEMAGCTSGALYGSFATRDDLINTVLTDTSAGIVRQLADRIEWAAESGETVPNVLLSARSRKASDFDRVIMAALANTARSGGDDPLGDQLARIRDTVAEIVREQQADQARVAATAGAGEPAPGTLGDPDAIADLVLTMLIGHLLLRSLELTSATPAECRAIDERIFDQIFDSI